jgi:pimeloyl-ACP methyl ester carboxylesterase
VEDSRADPGQVAGKGINDVVDHYARIIRGLEALPVVIGHSFGGLIAQRLLGQDLAATAVAIDAAPIKGVLNLPPSALKVASIALRKPANRNLAISLTEEQFRYGFGNALPERESADLYNRWAVPSPARPLFEAALANFTPQSPAKVNTGNKTRGPLLLTAGGNDHTVPAAITTSTRKLYHKSQAITDFIEFPDRGHSLTIDHGWQEVAQATLDWLGQRSSLPAYRRQPSRHSTFHRSPTSAELAAAPWISFTCPVRLLSAEPLDQVDVVVAVRVARRAAALGVSEPGVETGRLEGVGVEGNPVAAAAPDLSLGGGQEPGSQAVPALVVADPQQLDVAAPAPCPPGQPRAQVPVVPAGRDGQQAGVVVASGSHVEGDDLLIKPLPQVTVTLAGNEPHLIHDYLHSRDAQRE